MYNVQYIDENTICLKLSCMNRYMYMYMYICACVLNLGIVIDLTIVPCTSVLLLRVFASIYFIYMLLL